MAGDVPDDIPRTFSGWWFGTMEFYDFPYIGNHSPNWLIFFRGVGIPPISSGWGISQALTMSHGVSRDEWNGMDLAEAQNHRPFGLGDV
jgi:hypothetical protein